MKKLLAVLLSAAMILSSAALAFADEPETADEPEAVELPDVPDLTQGDYCAMAGDINLDGKVTSEDARFALRFAVGLEDEVSFQVFKDGAVARGNVDGRPGITAADARQILRIAVELEPRPGHQVEDVTVAEASWTSAGCVEHVCAYCGMAVAEPDVEPSGIDALIADANAWANDKGVANLIGGVSENEGKNVSLVINVDAVWDGCNVPEGAFDGLLTQLGAYVNEKLGNSVIQLDGNTVYNGKLLNTPVKNAIFSVFAGFFYKIANAADGVYGVYGLNIDGEDLALTVKMTGSETNVAKIRSFAGVIADHISADTSGADLIVTVEMPDALMNSVNARGGIEKVNASTLGACLNALKILELDSVIGSQVSAVNKLCATVCDYQAFVNKVLGKVTYAAVTVEGEEIALLADGAVFAPAGSSYESLLEAAMDMLSDDILSVKLGAFAQEDGTYKVPVTVTVNVANADVFTNNQITETVIFIFVP